jgi:hypothetical protein
MQVPQLNFHNWISSVSFLATRWRPSGEWEGETVTVFIVMFLPYTENEDLLCY